MYFLHFLILTYTYFCIYFYQFIYVFQIVTLLARIHKVVLKWKLKLVLQVIDVENVKKNYFVHFNQN